MKIMPIYWKIGNVSLVTDTQRHSKKTTLKTPIRYDAENSDYVGDRDILY